MATIPQIRNRLLQGFPEPQADLLAHVFVESHDELVTKAELNELTGVVKELAVAQSRTEQRVGELAVAQSRTEQQLGQLTKSVDRLAEVSCTADKDDIVRAARRAEYLRKIDIPALAFVACEAITQKTAELAGREKVRVLVEGRLLPDAV